MSPISTPTRTALHASTTPSFFGNTTRAPRGSFKRWSRVRLALLTQGAQKMKRAETATHSDRSLNASFRRESDSSAPPAHELERCGEQPRSSDCRGGKHGAEVGEPGEERHQADEEDLGNQEQNPGPREA
jgi:hypothetical protein